MFKEISKINMAEVPQVRKALLTNLLPAGSIIETVNILEPLGDVKNRYVDKRFIRVIYFNKSEKFTSVFKYSSIARVDNWRGRIKKPTPAL